MSLTVERVRLPEEVDGTCLKLSLDLGIEHGPVMQADQEIFESKKFGKVQRYLTTLHISAHTKGARLPYFSHRRSYATVISWH